MKRLQIALIGITGVVMVLLCVVLGIFLTQRIPSGAGRENYTLVQEKKIPAGEVQSLKIDYGMNSTDVLICQGTGEEVVVREYMNFKPDKKQLSSVELKSGELVIRGARKNLFTFFGIGFRGAYTEIYLPTDLAQELKSVTVKTVSGDISSEAGIKVQDSFTVSTTSGGMSLSQVQAGEVRASTTSGDIWFPEIQAGGIGASSTSGSIRLDSASAQTLDVSTTSGDVTIKWASGKTNISSTSGEIQVSELEGAIRTSTTSGDIILGKITGAVNLSTTSGSVRLEEGQDGLDAESTSGDIQAGLLKGDFRMDTTSGELLISNGEGSGTAHSVSGDIHIFLAGLTGDLKISTTSGEVGLKLPERADFRFSFHTTSGGCQTFFEEALSFDSKRKNAKGQYGGGTHSVEVSTVSGDLEVGAFPD